VVICLVALCISASLCLIIQGITLSSASSIENEQAQSGVQRALTIMNLELSHIDGVVQDWAFWDDTYTFVETNSTDYIEGNLMDSTFTSLGIDLFVVVNSSKQFVFGKAYDLDNMIEAPLPEDLQQHLAPSSNLLNQSNTESGAMGIMLLEENPMLVASRPILTSERQGPVHGTLIMGRFLDSAEISSLAAMAGVSLVASTADESQSLPDLQSARPLTFQDHLSFVRTLNSTVISAYTLLTDIEGSPAVVLEADMERSMFMQAQASLFYLGLSVSIVDVVFAGIVIALLSRLVLSRLASLSRKIGKIEKSGRLDERVSVGGSDELSSLAAGINRMLEKLGQKEEAIRESQAEFEGLFRNNPEAACHTDLEYRVLEINPRFEKLFGYSVDEARGKHIDDLVVPSNKIEEAEALNKKASEGYVYFDTERKRKDGSLVAVAVSACSMAVDGKTAGYIVIYKDISDLKIAEKKVLVAMEKLRVMGSLTRHDLRNKLQVFDGFSYLLRKKLTNDEEAKQYLEDMEQSSKQMLSILEFSRLYEQIGVEEPRYVDVEQLVDEASALFTSLESVELANGCGGLRVLADSLLRQIFYNLIHNTLKYGEKTSRMRIYYEKAEDSELRLIYEDDGVGIPPSMRANLFKEGCGKGTGYGLYLIKRICETYGWKIQETGEQGHGVRFVMSIPYLNQNGNVNYQLSQPSADQEQEFYVSEPAPHERTS
jgi:PAS domain S-box-containing protein